MNSDMSRGKEELQKKSGNGSEWRRRSCTDSHFHRDSLGHCGANISNFGTAADCTSSGHLLRQGSGEYMSFLRLSSPCSKKKHKWNEVDKIPKQIYSHVSRPDLQGHCSSWFSAEVPFVDFNSNLPLHSNGVSNMEHNGIRNLHCNWTSNIDGHVFTLSPLCDRRDRPLEHVEDFLLSHGANSWPESRFKVALDGYLRNESLRLPRSKAYLDTLQKKYFIPHLQRKAINEALEKGKAFKATFRVNMHNHFEAYCTLEGVSTDILINGLIAQNRAVEGDVVAIVLDPLSSWPKLKGPHSKKKIKNVDNKDNDNTIPEEDHFKAQYKVDELCKNRHPGQLFDISLDGEILNGCLDHEHTVLCRQKRGYINETDTNILCNGGSCKTAEQHLPNPCSSECGLSDDEQDDMAKALVNVSMLVNSRPDRRPTGRVIGIIEKSCRRDAVIGFLEVKQWLAYMESCSRSDQSPQKTWKGSPSCKGGGSIKFVPTDPRFPKMTVFVSSLPDNLKNRLHEGDLTLESELVATSIDVWRPESFLPLAIVKHSFGQGGEIEAQTSAILFEHAIHGADFLLESLACLPRVPWKIPMQEYKARRDLRSFRVFSIDPPTARDVDDALSIENIGDGVMRVGVHIADVSYFVWPNTMLDREAQDRSTSIYLTQHIFPMLPRLLSEGLCSLIPGVDRLAFSVMFDINSSGEVLDQWMGRTVIQSCCKLSYQHAQEVIEGNFYCNKTTCSETACPEVHGGFEWQDIVADIQCLHKIAQQRRESRFGKGALRLDNCQLVFVLDEDGMPCDSMFYEQKDSNILVEEFMVLANMTVAKVISRAFPECSLLRRHPEPNLRKLKDLQVFCNNLGFHLDVSSARALHMSLEKLKDDLKDDPSLFNIIVLYATKPMQLATYFCTGELRDKESEWAHYALAAPLYTHFTSPIRRYADIVVHRLLAATLEAEDIYQKQLKSTLKPTKQVNMTLMTTESPAKCFTGLVFNKEASESPAGHKALLTASMKHKVPRTAEIALVAEHCNERNLASKNVQEATDKLYLWALLKKQKLISKARVLALGPKFMSVYIYKFAIERRIYFDEIDGLVAEWFESIGTLVLKMKNQSMTRTCEDIAPLVNPPNPVNSSQKKEAYKNTLLEIEERLKGELLSSSKVYFDLKDLSNPNNTEPAVLPLTLRVLSTVPVSVHAVGGEHSSPDIAVQFFLNSYLT